MASYISGKEFNRRTAGLKLIKVLNRDLVHNGYRYEPNTLNELKNDEFDPNPKCKSGGLYFGEDKHIFEYVRMMYSKINIELGSLVATVTIPDDARVSIGTNEYKTDKIILGEPMEVNQYITDDYILTASYDVLMTILTECSYIKDFKIATRIYRLVESGFPIIYKYIMMKTNINFFSILSDDMFELWFSQHFTECYPHRNGFVNYINQMVQDGNLDIIKHCHAKALIDLTNSRILKIALDYNKIDVFDYLLSIGVDIDSPQCDGCVSLLEYVLNDGDLGKAKILIERGAKINKCSDALLINSINNNREKITKFIRDMS